MRLYHASGLIALFLLSRVGFLPACEITTYVQRIGTGTMVYNTAGQGEPVLLLHGLFAAKEQWNPLLCRLANAGFRPIAVDLPGYGKSDGFALPAYPLERQAMLLHRFAKALRLERFDIAGSSMGGAIASLYADRYRHQILSLAFIGAPLGIAPWAHGVQEAIRQGINPFIPIDEPQFDLELSILFVHPPPIPEAEKRRLIADYVSRNRHYVQVWNIVNLYDDVLNRKPLSPVPALILWGGVDRIYNVRGARKLHDRMPGSKLHILDGAGHLLLMENAEQAGTLYLNFLQGRTR